VSTAPAGQSANMRQATFIRCGAHARGRVPSARSLCLSAFNAPGGLQDATGVPGPHPEEAWRELYDSARRPKAAVDQLALLAQDRPSRN
jgi:hypothetical protein